jgi:hypothetical protein
MKKNPNYIEFKTRDPFSPLSKVDNSRLNYVKNFNLIRNYTPRPRPMLTSPYLWQFFCKQQDYTKSEEVLFEIQIIGLEQAGSLLTKETLWKK